MIVQHQHFVLKTKIWTNWDIKNQNLDIENQSFDNFWHLNLDFDQLRHQKQKFRH